MKRILLTIAFVLGNANFVQAQTSFTDATAIGVWNTTRWNNSTDGPSYTSTYTVANAVSFTAGTYSIAGMGASINVGNVTVTNGVTVSFTANANTFATGGNIRTLDVGASGLLDFSSQAISTAAGTGFIKNGAGVLALNGSSYAGGFTLNSGTVVVRGVNAMGSGGSLTINGGVIAANGNRDLTGKYGGGITVGGDFILGASTGLASASANLTFSNNINLGAATRTISIGGSGLYTLGGVISNTSGGLNVNGSGGGGMLLSGANTYTGGTTVSAGTLSAGNNTAFGSGVVSVSGGSLTLNSGITLNNAINVGASGRINGNAASSTLSGTISGSGTLGGSLTVSGTLSPGNSPGIMTIDGNLTLGSAAIYQWELANLSTSGAGTNFDQISLTSSGSLAINSGATLAPVFGASLAPNEGNSFWNTNRSWAVVQNNGSGTITGSFLINNSPWSNGTFSFNSSNSQVTLDWTAAAVPEPSTYAVLFGIATLVFVALRQRAHKVPPAAV